MLVVICILMFPCVISYSSGPLPSVCDSMVPGHRVSAQPGTPPYIIKLPPGQTTYSDREQIDVTLEGKGEKTFRGFMIQARPDSGTYMTYGSMSNMPSNTKNVCKDKEAGKNVAITHGEGSEKTSVTFTWTAPPADVGNIVFLYSVVHIKAEFWVKAKSGILTYKQTNTSSKAGTPPRQTTKTPTRPSTNKVIKKDSRCGDSIGCYHDCDSSDSCGFLLTWMENGDDVDFTLTCKRGGNNVYCAIGLSKDKKMGDDSVFECVSSDGTVSVFVSYNEGRNNYRLKIGAFGISKITASHKDGILQCTFSRKKTFAKALAGRKRRAVEASTSTYFDINENFNLLYAYGTAIGGILMMFAWLFFATFGIFMARFYKTVWPDGMEWCGQKRWFILHRFFMVTTFLLTAASFIVIFVHVGAYSKIEGNNFQKSHPIIGIVVMSLVTINPIMALFRPHPGTPKRPYFNFAHISVGVTSYVCAVVNMFSGFNQSAADVPFSAKIVVWIYLGWVGLVELTSYIYDCQTRKGTRQCIWLMKYFFNHDSKLLFSGSKGEAYEMKSTNTDHETSIQDVSRFKIATLCIHAVALFSFVIAAAAIVGVGDTQHQRDI